VNGWLSGLGCEYAMPIPQVDTKRPESARIVRSSPRPPLMPARDTVILRRKPQQRGIAGPTAAPGQARGPIRTRSGPFESGCGQGIGCDFSRRYHVTVCLVRPANIPSVRPEPVEGRGQTIAPHSKQFPAHLPRAAFDKLRLSGGGVDGWSVNGWDANMASFVCHSARGSHQSGNEGPGVGGRMSALCHPAG